MKVVFQALFPDEGSTFAIFVHDQPTSLIRSIFTMLIIDLVR